MVNIGTVFASHIHTMSVSTVTYFHQFDEAKWNFAHKNASSLKAAVDSSAVYSDQISADRLPQNNDFKFSDFIDIVNPLQHLPVVNTLYQNLTGDTMEGFSRVIGGTLYGGPLGTASAVTNEILEDTSGKDIGGHMLAMLTPEENLLVDKQIAQQEEEPLTIEIRGRNYIDDLGDLVTSDTEPLHNKSIPSDKQSLLKDELTLGLIYLQEELHLEARTEQTSSYTNIS